MFAEPRVTRDETAEVHDSANPRSSRGFAKVAGRDTIRLEVIAVCPHGVHEVIRHVDAGEGAIERHRIEQVARNHFGRRQHPRRERGRVARETPEPNPRGFQDGHEPSSDIASRARDEDGWYLRPCGREDARHGI